jgi:primosomal protein N' (replication factor Y)
VDVPLPHLDRSFDYLVPEADAAAAEPGVRVRVRFARQLVDGWLLERVAASDHPGDLLYLERVVSPERVLHPEVLRLARALAARYAGNLADVLRLAVPPRHARVEAEPAPPAADRAATPDADRPPGEGAGPPAEPGAGPSGPDAVRSGGPAPGPTAGPGGPADRPPGSGWDGYPAGAAFLRALAERRAPRAVWTATPGEDWPARLAEATAAAVRAGRGAVLVVADARDLDRLDAALTATLGAGRHVALSAALGPAERYRRFLRASRGQVPVVVGTRAAALAPVPDLGLVAIWDDGDDLHAEPRAPYPHARETLLLRAHLAGAAALVGGFTRTAEAQQLLATGWARPVTADRTTLRARAPAVTPTGDDPQLARDPAAAAARLPSEAWRAARDALAAGAPVLVQVPRRGYLPAVACARCRTPARCPHCAGPLELRSAHATAVCRWCARPATGFTCAECGARRLRAAVTGARRTAEELGRAFPGYPVRTSGRGGPPAAAPGPGGAAAGAEESGVLASVPARPAVVVATPGAEPVAEGGYGAVLLLDAWALLTRADLRAGEETLRRWLAAAALARPAAAGGRVVVVADGGLPPVQALLRFDPGWYAERELAERRALGFPPAARVATVTGSPAGVAELLAAAALPEQTQVLGPVPVGDDQERMLLRVPRRAAAALAAALHTAAGVRSARKAPEPVRVQMDPLDLL